MKFTIVLTTKDNSNVVDTGKLPKGFNLIDKVRLKAKDPDLTIEDIVERPWSNGIYRIEVSEEDARKMPIFNNSTKLYIVVKPLYLNQFINTSVTNADVPVTRHVNTKGSQVLVEYSVHDVEILKDLNKPMFERTSPDDQGYFDNVDFSFNRSARVVNPPPTRF